MYNGSGSQQGRHAGFCFSAVWVGAKAEDEPESSKTNNIQNLDSLVNLLQVNRRVFMEMFIHLIWVIVGIEPCPYPYYWLVISLLQVRLPRDVHLPHF